jgi:hypothetical protein
MNLSGFEAADGDFEDCSASSLESLGKNCVSLRIIARRDASSDGIWTAALQHRYVLARKRLTREPWHLYTGAFQSSMAESAQITGVLFDSSFTVHFDYPPAFSIFLDESISVRRVCDLRDVFDDHVP